MHTVPTISDAHFDFSLEKLEERKYDPLVLNGSTFSVISER